MLGQVKKFISLGLALGFATTATAEVVHLKSLDGGTTLSGELIDFDGQNYTIRTIVGELVLDAFLVECISGACPQIATNPDTFGISGSSNVVDTLFADLLFEFGLDIGGDTMTSLDPSAPTEIQLYNELGNELANVALKGEGARQGLQDLFSGEASLAVLSRAVSQDENAIFKIAGHGDLTTPAQQTIFALDGLVIVTSKNNPIRVIAQEDLADIFSGVVTNWKQIGGEDAKINLYASNESSGTGVVFHDLVMKPANTHVSSTATILDTDAAVAAAVAADPLGIGVASFANPGNAKVLDIRGACGIQVPATSFTIKTEEYPLTRRLYTYTTAGETPAQLARFLDFLETDSAQAAIANSGYVDLGLSYQSNDQQGLRYLSAIIPTDVEMTLPQLRKMTESLLSSDRMSITYRFAMGSARLDERAKDDIQRLAQILSTGDFENKEILLIGFTDSIGAGSANINLSAQRAGEVRTALLAALPAGLPNGFRIPS